MDQRFRILAAWIVSSFRSTPLDPDDVQFAGDVTPSTIGDEPLDESLPEADDDEAADDHATAPDILRDVQQQSAFI